MLLLSCPAYSAVRLWFEQFPARKNVTARALLILRQNGSEKLIRRSTRVSKGVSGHVAARGEGEKKLRVLFEEGKNRPNIDSQEKIHRGILRGRRNISETP